MAEHRSYADVLLPAIDAGLVRALAHITGGGLVDNVPRVLPDDLAAHFDPRTWSVPPIFPAIQRAAHVADAEMYRVFNMGIGMVVIVAPEQVATRASASRRMRSSSVRSSRVATAARCESTA